MVTPNLPPGRVSTKQESALLPDDGVEIALFPSDSVTVGRLANTETGGLAFML